MPVEIIGTFDVRGLRILDENGEADPSLMPELTDDQIKEIYELLVLARTFDRRALDLHGEGRIGTYASVLGQEASQVGTAFALREKGESILFPSFRESAVYITLGYPLHMLYQYWAGDERGMKTPEGLNILPISIPVGTHIPHAVGAAMGAKLRGDKTAAAAYFGDGGTSKGDFHESMNISGVFKLPVIFICQNNQWAISMPRERQTAARTLAQKALSYGFEGVWVDGNDIFAVYKATDDAVKKALAGGGPTFIECFTYRLSDHTTADDASRYRTKEEVGKWRLKDPVERLRLFMEKGGLLSKDFASETLKKATDAVDEAVKKAESQPPPSPKDMFAFTYTGLTGRQMKQLREAGWQ